MAKKATTVTKAQQTLPEGLDLAQMTQDAQNMNPVMDAADVALPYMYLLQPLSPQVQIGNAQRIAAASAGMLFNNVSGEVFDGMETGLQVIPCYYERKLVEWVERSKGGGWVADHALDSDILRHTQKNDKGQPVLPNGNLIIETAYHYVLALNPNKNEWEQFVIPMKSTGMKANRRWNNAIVTTKIPGTDVTAPRWLFPYSLKTITETKNENTWFNFDMVQSGTMVDSDLYAKAKVYAEMIAAGLVKRVAESVDGDKIDPNTGEVFEENKDKEQIEF